MREEVGKSLLRQIYSNISSAKSNSSDDKVSGPRDLGLLLLSLKRISERR
jgi:hypothetical protein